MEINIKGKIFGSGDQYKRQDFLVVEINIKGKILFGN
jgi:hypothetical protein